MSEALEYMNGIRRMLETLMQDGIMDSQTCEQAKTWIDSATTAMDEAIGAQTRSEAAA